jgi:hypothetical protein
VSPLRPSAVAAETAESAAAGAAIEFYMSVLAVSRSVPYVAARIGSGGGVQTRQVRKYGMELRVYRSRERGCSWTLVLNNRHLADAVERISQSLTKAGDYGSTLQLQQAAHSITARSFGPDHPEALNSHHHLADALDFFGRHQEAADLHQQILTTRERVLGADHPDTLLSRNNLANALDHLGRH